MANFCVKKHTLEKVKKMQDKKLVKKDDEAYIYSICHFEPSDYGDECGDLITVRYGKYEIRYWGEKGFKTFLKEWEIR